MNSCERFLDKKNSCFSVQFNGVERIERLGMLKDAQGFNKIKKGP
jgi:hypothetical protein